MSRYLRNVRRRKTKRIISFFIISIVLMIFLILIVDYRVNNSLGDNKIRIVLFESNNEEFTIKLFNKHKLSINMIYIKKDINKIVNKIKSISNIVNNNGY